MSTAMLDRVYVDFNPMLMDEQERVSIHPTMVRPSFRPGLRLVLYDEELEVEAELDGEAGRAGGVFGFWLAKWDVPVVAVLCLGAVALLYGAMRFVDANVDAVRREWLSYSRGLDGERLVSSILDGLGSEWHVFHGLQLRQGQDFDHVLVGPGGLFYIQTKNWRGLLTRQGDSVLRNGERIEALGTIRSQAMQLKDRLSKEPGSPVRWVNAILAVPFAWTDVKGEPKNVAVLHQQDLLEYIQCRSKRFDQAQIDWCVAALNRIASARAAPCRRPAGPALAA